MPVKNSKDASTEQAVFFDNEVLEKIAGKTANEIDGILSLKGNLFDNISDRFTSGDNPESGVDINLDEEQKTVDIEVNAILEYGKKAEEILDRMTTRIANAVNMMTGYKVTEVVLQVKDILTREEWQQKKSPKKDKKKDNDKESSSSDKDED